MTVAVQRPEVPLQDVAEIISGQSPPGETYRDKPEGLPFFQGKADFGPRHPVARKWCVAPERIAEAGDILISVRAPVGPTNIADQRCCIGRGLAAIRCNASKIDRDYLLHVLRWIEPLLAEKGSGSTFESITRADLTSLIVPVPPLEEQRRTAARLEAGMAAIARAHAASQARLDAAKRLPGAFLAAAFGDDEALQWPRVRLATLAALLPSKSIATDGDEVVTAVTTACLTESGFNPAGVKAARMFRRDVAECRLSPGEILVARSNTPELVGRAAMYEGEPVGAIAADLTMRVQTTDPAFAPLLSAYLSHLFLAGYWRERAGGASGTMKKITRSQITALEVPVPPQESRAALLDRITKERTRALSAINAVKHERSVIEALPSALLREVFHEGMNG